MLKKTLIFLGLLTAAAASASNWQQKMQQLSVNLQGVLPYLASVERYTAKSDKREVQKRLDQIAKMAHGLKKIKSEDSDPSLQLISRLFEEEARSARDLYRDRLYEASLYRSRALISYCVGCHTRHGTQKSFSSSKRASGSPDAVFNQASAWVAGRQFDGAFESYLQLAKDYSWAIKKPFRWESAVKKALVISVRVKEDLDLTYKLIRIAQKNPKVSYYFSWDLEKWKDSVDFWKAEEKKVAKRSSKKGRKEAKELFDRAKSWVMRGRRTWDMARDQAGMLDFLRASALFHTFLKKFPNHRRLPEVLYYLGYTYDAMSDLEVSSLHEWYYTLCIERAPKTTTAKKCYANLEESTAGTYLRATRVQLPDDIEKRLKRLKAVAF